MDTAPAAATIRQMPKADLDPIWHGERDEWMFCMRRAVEETLPEDEFRPMLLRALSDLAEMVRNR
jgi:truncated hemoglobin YjbI